MIASSGTPRPRPLFLVGAARSGTTLISLMLDGHSAVAIPYESHFIPRFERRIAAFGDLTAVDQRRRLVEAILAEDYVAAWDVTPTLEDVDLDRCTSLAAAIDQVFSAYARGRGKLLWGDKTPSYLTEIDALNRLFPEAGYIHIVRDGRDVALSQVERWWGPGDFVSAMRRWRIEVTLARKMLAMLPDDRHLEIRFEDFVATPQAHLESICSLLGIAFEPEMLSAYRGSAKRKVGERLEAHHQNLAQPPSLEHCYKWKRTLGPADQAIAHEIAGELLSELGYDPGRQHHPLRLPRKLVHRVREASRWRMAGARRRATPRRSDSDRSAAPR